MRRDAISWGRASYYTKAHAFWKTIDSEQLYFNKLI